MTNRDKHAPALSTRATLLVFSGGANPGSGQLSWNQRTKAMPDYEVMTWILQKVLVGWTVTLWVAGYRRVVRTDVVGYSQEMKGHSNGIDGKKCSTFSLRMVHSDTGPWSPSYNCHSWHMVSWRG